MGMFDELRIEAALPDPEYQQRTWQTKSLACCLDTYLITTAGRLIELVREGQFVDEPNKLFGFRFEQTGTREVLLDDFHGDIIFYDIVNAPDDSLFAVNLGDGTTSALQADGRLTPLAPVMIYYKARFTEGWLQWIRRIDKEEAWREW